MRYTLLILFAVTVAAFLLRVPQLSQRAMHTDEAVHAIKFGELLEKGEYRYDPYEFHGPTLNYFTLIPAWLSNTNKLVDVTENHLRIVTVVFGVVLVFIPVLIRRGLGNLTVIFAAVFTALSPAMVYYSRYYIMEIPLVVFTFGVIAFAYRYTVDRNVLWAAATGICIGLVQATKETSIIAFFAMFWAVVLAHWMHRRDWSSRLQFRSLLQPLHLALALAAAIVVIVMFYSSFFTYWKGVVDALLTYTTYLDRGSGNSFHLYPWHYYLELLSWWHLPGGQVWSEVIILLLAITGGWYAIRRRTEYTFDVHLGRFLVFYTVVMMTVYSLIPYKTPWNLLSFYHGVLILAGLGISGLIQSFRSLPARTVIGLVVAAGCLHLLWQTYEANYRQSEEPTNPWVYAHPLSDVKEIAEIIDAYAEVDRSGRNMHIDVICPQADVWPLPWYLRAYPRIGWWPDIDYSQPAARLILALPRYEEQLMEKLYSMPPPGQKHLYLPLYRENRYIRPGIEIYGYVRKDLWDALQYR